MPKISLLPPVATPTTADILPIDQSLVTSRTTLGALFTSLLGFIQSGTGAAARTQQDKSRDIISVSDFSSATTASTGAAGGTVIVPAGVSPTLPATYPNVMFDYLNGSTINMFGTLDSTITAKRTLRSYHAGAHSNNQKASLAVEAHAVGSGLDGPTSADYGIMLSIQKENFATSVVEGELDALTIGVRQGGPNSDACAILTNVQQAGTGFVGVLEGNTSNLVANVVTQLVGTQIGVVDTRAGAYYGYVATKATGNGGVAYLGQHTTGGNQWDNFLLFFNDAVNVFSVDKNGWLTLQDASLGATPKKTLRVNAGSFSILNNAGGAEILNITDAGLLTTGQVNSNIYQSGGTQVVGARQTGWSAMTGTLNKATVYDPSTITLVQLAQRVNSLQAALTLHGMIGT